MNLVKTIGLTLLGALVVIQFIHPKKNQLPVNPDLQLASRFSIPDSVNAILQKACMDCHSNTSRYPWYASIQPVAWWLDEHIRDGKKHLNFDEYTHRSLRYQYHKMEETIEMVKEEEMPLPSYTWTHTEARLSTAERVAITQWAQSVMDTMKHRYPADSLVKPRKS
ncbi:MAG: heme-binding domain-containing protein [Sphingomonadales bacterium]|nr:cytochrome C [Sphingomonadales bacterium]